MKAHLLFKGGTVYGFGTIRGIREKDGICPSHCTKVFENNTGLIFFNSFFDNQVKGLQKLEELSKSKI